MAQRIIKKRGRDRLFIIAEILDIAKEGAQKTAIMYKANLSFRQLNSYMSILLETGLLKKATEKKEVLYHTTEKGFEYLYSYREVLDSLSGISRLKATGTLTRIRSSLRDLEKHLDRLKVTLANWSECPFCKKEILPDFEFCPYCGRELPEKQRAKSNKEKPAK